MNLISIIGTGFILLMFFGLPVAAIGTGWSIAEAEKKEEEAKQERLQYLNTFTKHEVELIQKILKDHKWVEVSSPTYYQETDSEGSIYVNAEAKAVALATNFAKEFAIFNGYDPDLIYKLYRMYNIIHGKFYYGRHTYSTKTIEPGHTLISGQQFADPPDTFTTDHRVTYNIGYFILEKK